MELVTFEELKAELRRILAYETEQRPDWDAIESACLALIARLASEPVPKYPHEIVYHYLDDPDIRRKDAVYAEMQQTRLSEWLQ